jgi:hypothetical protein
MNTTLTQKTSNLEMLPTHPSMVKLIETELIEPPIHGSISITLVFRDERLIRWVTTREESRLVE